MSKQRRPGSDGIDRRMKSKIAKPEVVKEELMAKISALRRRCYSQTEMAKELGVGIGTIGMYERELVERYRTTVLSNQHELVNEMVERYMEVALEAWKAWEISKKDGRRTVEELSPRVLPDGSRQDDSRGNGRGRGSCNKSTPRMLKVRVINTREGRLPNSQYLKIVVDCLDAVRSLRGLDAPKEMNVNHQVIDWTELAKGMPEEVPDEVEARIKEVLADNMTRGGRPTIIAGEVGEEVIPGDGIGEVGNSLNTIDGVSQDKATDASLASNRDGGIGHL